MASNEYLILRPEKIGLVDALSLLLFRRRRLTSYKFVESSSSTTALDGGGATADWVTGITLIVQKFLLSISTPMKWFGFILEFFLNLFSLNGGILGLLWHLITLSVVIPKREAANFRSFLGHVDGRTKLYNSSSSSLMNYFPVMGSTDQTGLGYQYDLTMMAAKIAYENAAYIQDAVTNNWKMNFVGFFNCWNKFTKQMGTQAFIFCDKAEDASVIILAFRGTEPFNAQDWVTDVDLSWLSMGKMGHVHVGFLKALGLQDEKDYRNGFPKEFNGTDDQDKPVAYYAIRKTLNNLVNKHKNARIVVTGHSLGGALAIIFPSILAMHDQDAVLNKIDAVVTYGQPRVGDATFGSYMETIVRLRYIRMVYRYDIVPRIPFDIPVPIAMFKHFGTCGYFKSWYEVIEVVDDCPNPNYVDPSYMLSMYLNAWGDLFKALFIGKTQGKEFKEGYVSILFRATGLILPGLASHSPRDYVNAVRLAKLTPKDIV